MSVLGLAIATTTLVWKTEFVRGTGNVSRAPAPGTVAEKTPPSATPKSAPAFRGGALPPPGASPLAAATADADADAPAGRALPSVIYPDGANARPEDVDFTRDYIFIKGHKAHPRRLLAKFAGAMRGEARARFLQPFAFRVSAEYTLTPGVVALYSTAEAEPPVASADEAAGRGEEMLKRIKALLQTGEFSYVEPDYIYALGATPADTAFTNGSLWGLRNTGQLNGTSGADIDAVRAWDLTTGSSNVIVAVIDSGVRYTHQDLAPNMWINRGETGTDSQGRDRRTNGVDDDGDGYIDNVYGLNAPSRSGDPLDDVGHGSHVSGTIGAAANGGGQHVGVAWQVQIMACKAGTSRGIATADAKTCIDFAVSKGARVLSNSWGGTVFNQALFDSIRAARDRGVLFVAAAGNGGIDGIGDDNDVAPTYPASYALDNIISVAALDRQDKLVNFSNYGAATVHLGAPGEEILSCWNGSDTDYRTIGGTSMATPHVSGVAALVLARFPSISLFELRQRILDGAVPISALRGKAISGGRLNAFNAVNAQSDGVPEIVVLPADGSTLVAGTATTFLIQVTDLVPITNATVSGTITGGPAITFTNNGTAPDVTAGDHIYSATINVPSSGTSLSLQVQVTAPDKTPGTRTYTFPIRQPPPNDSFANRSPLSGSTASATGSNALGSRETGEPNHADVTGGHSVWWTWTAPSNGIVTINTYGSSFDTVLGVYTGTAVNALTRVASNDDSGDSYASLVSFNATSGTAYQIAVDGYGGATGNIALSVSLTIPPPAPANDDFANAIALSGSPATTTGANSGATRQTGEPNHAGIPGGRSVWWRWTAPGTGQVTITTDGSNFDTLLAVYTGSSVSALTTIASDDDSGEGTRSLVQFNASSGTTYYIAVDGYNGVVGNITLAVTQSSTSPAPTNDNFASRVSLSGSTPTATGSNVGATKETNEPDHANNSGGRSVWWTWTAPSAGSVTITTAGSNFDTLLAVYTGTSVSALTAIASNNQDPAGGNTSRVQFNATSGTTYQIAVDGNNTGLTVATGSITLGLTLTATSSAPANDSFASRITITGSSATVSGSNANASRETGEPTHANVSGGRSVWWTWTAPSAGNVTVSTSGSNFDTVLGVYTGTIVSSLTLVAANDDTGASLTSLVTFNATAGTAYQIAVDGYAGQTGTISLNVTQAGSTPAPNPAPAGAEYYGTAGTLPNRLFRIDPATGATTNIADMSLVFGLDFNSSGVLYGCSSSLATISLTTGALTTIGSLPELMVSIAFSPTGELYGVSNDGLSLYRLSPTTGASLSRVAITGTTFASGGAFLGEINGIDFGPDGTLYGIGFGLYRINPSTGVATRITPAGQYAGGSSADLFLDLDYGPDGQLRAGGFGTGALFAINPTTGVGTRVGVTTAGGIASRGSSPIPAPAITTQPIAQSGTVGGSVTFSVAASGSGNTYQWRRNGVNIAGATNATLVLTNLTASDAGTYDVVIRNGSGSITSSAVALTVASNVGRLINLSVLTSIASNGDSFTLGYVVGGSGTTGAKPLLIRAAGPSLAAIGVPGTLDDPRLELFTGSTRTAENDNWGGSSTLVTAMTAVGAFPFTSPTSRDAAVLTSVSSRDNSVRVSAAGTGTGAVIAEIYDATPPSAFTTTTPRLVNVSVLKHIGSGVTAGFVIGGTGPRTILVRAIGPTLGSAFGVSGAVADPQLTLFSGLSRVNENDNWGGTAALTSAFTAVGAFSLPVASRDAAIVATLNPGAYSVEVKGVSNTTGIALVEIYEVP